MFAQFALFCAAALLVLAAERKVPAETIFTGAQSCASSSCHGGGTGRNEFLIYNRKDRHVFAAGILGKGTSLKIAEALGIGDPTTSAQCTVCHSPMEAVPASRLAAELKPPPDHKPNPDRGVSCEACHGAAGEWLRFHTRPDVTYQQILGTGLRDLIDITGRANVCVACHLNLDESIRHAGHPELFFELDGQAIAEPPHYVDVRPSLGPRSWLTGQAVALREMSWKLATKRDERLLARWKALVWLLQTTEDGKKELPAGEDFSAMQSAADRLAQQAARNLWTRTQVSSLLKQYVSLHREFGDGKTDRTELRRRAEVLVPAIDRLWAALKKEGGMVAPEVEKDLDAAYVLARQQDDFEPAQFAVALSQLEATLDHHLKP
ncbi:MAG: multiheme c-type cytochrome [Chthoniobacteraceae bacterium]